MRRLRARGAQLVVAAALAACSWAGIGCTPDAKHREDCLTLAAEYRAAMDRAILCDPLLKDSCSVGRPLMLYQQHDDGTVEFKGLCGPPCLGAVNAATTAELDAILGRFEAAACEVGNCWCPDPLTMPPTCLDSGQCWGFAPASGVELH